MIRGYFGPCSAAEEGIKTLGQVGTQQNEKIEERAKGQGQTVDPSGPLFLFL